MEDQTDLISRIEQILGRSIKEEKNNIKSFDEVTEADLNDFRKVRKEGLGLNAVYYIKYRVENASLSEVVGYYALNVEQSDS